MSVVDKGLVFRYFDWVKLCAESRFEIKFIKYLFMKRKADPSWDRDNSDEVLFLTLFTFKSDGEGKNFSKQAQSSSEVQHPAVFSYKSC